MRKIFALRIASSMTNLIYDNISELIPFSNELGQVCEHVKWR